MKKLFLVLATLFFASVAWSQSTTVSATVTDSDGFIWANGTYTFSFVPGPADPNPVNYVWSGGALSLQINGSMNSSGVLSQSVPSSTSITPAGSTWAITIRPNATNGTATLAALSITGGSLSLTTQLSAIAAGPRFSASQMYGYGTVEVTAAKPGYIFQSTLPSDGKPYSCNSAVPCVWTVLSTGGGSGTVTSFSAGTLSPLFTTSVATPTATPALTFALSNAAQNTVLAGPTSGTGAPAYRALVAADIPTPIILVGSTSGSVTLKPDATTTALYMSDTPPTIAGSVLNNLVIGTAGSGSALAPGAGAVGGQKDVILGSGACPLATSMREAVCIGSQAGAAITGNGSGADDNIFVLIGSQAGTSISDTTSGSGVLIGQKVLNTATKSINDVLIGTHTGDGISATSGQNTLVGDNIFNPTPIAGSFTGNAFLGYLIAHEATGVFTDDVCLGMQTCDVLGAASDRNVVIGMDGGGSLTTGTYNILIGAQSAIQKGAGITGSNNVFIDPVNSSAIALTSGSNNLVLGQGGIGITTGSDNVAIARLACNAMTAGSNNVCVGVGAGQNATGITDNTLIGGGAGAASQGTDLTAVGRSAMTAITTGAHDTAVGYHTCLATTTGADNTCVGYNIAVGTTGAGNTVVGSSATGATTGANNTVVGFSAKGGTTATENVSIGHLAGQSLTTGSNNICIGGGGQTCGPLTTGASNVMIGVSAGQNMTAAASNVVAVGQGAGFTAASFTTAIGKDAGHLATGAGTFVGYLSANAVTSGTGIASLGTSACHLLTTETNDTCLGETADVAVGISGSVELGPGSCAVSNALCINAHQIADTSGNLVTTGSAKSATYLTATNCSSGASPAVCGSASAGSVAMPTGTNPTLVINTSAVTANSEILLTVDDSVTIASTTCNSTLATLVGGMAITARIAATSFTVSYNGTVAVNPVCFSYRIIN